MLISFRKESDVKDDYLQYLKNNLLTPYPTTIRRTVSLRNFISIDHTVDAQLYKSWIAEAIVTKELRALHQKMKKTVLNYLKNESLEVKFIHFHPV